MDGPMQVSKGKSTPEFGTESTVTLKTCSSTAQVALRLDI